MEDESILFSTKKMLGYSEDYTAFDHDIVVFINGVFSDLDQLGIGPTGGYTIGYDGSELWGDYVTTDVPSTMLQSVRTYVFLRVRMLHDPSMTGVMKDAMMAQIDKLEWRLNSARESMIHPLSEFVEEEV